MSVAAAAKNKTPKAQKEIPPVPCSGAAASDGRTDGVWRETAQKEVPPPPMAKQIPSSEERRPSLLPHRCAYLIVMDRAWPNAHTRPLKRRPVRIESTPPPASSLSSVVAAPPVAAEKNRCSFASLGEREGEGKQKQKLFKCPASGSRRRSLRALHFKSASSSSVV